MTEPTEGPTSIGDLLMRTFHLRGSTILPSVATQCVTLALGMLLTVTCARAEDWPYWRGPHFNGVSYETGLIDTWDAQGGPQSNVLWQRDDLGGRSTPVVLNGRLYTIVSAEPGTPREGERVVCVDAATGKDIWENRFNVWLSDVPDTRVGWSSCVADPETGNVYALGVFGYFLCMDGAK